MIAAVLVARGLSGWFFDASILSSAAALAVVVFSSVLAFAITCELFGTFGVRDLIKALRRS